MGHALGQNRASPEGVAAKIAGAPKRGAGAPVSGDATVKARVRNAQFWRSPVPLRGRIQAHTAWNLLPPARDTLSLGLPISAYWLHLASRHHQFWQQRTCVSWCCRL